MKMNQLDHWLHGHHRDSYAPPKIYVISCEDVSEYLLAVEYKHKLEPIHKDGEPMHFQSLDLVKEELVRMGVESVYLRLHNTDDEFGAPQGTIPYHDIELSIKPH
ncbi:DUF6482 family protein [Vibrio hannami]|uniref:DUF6482 family protein n=1 Tax=Vibrio hannami TaxID=2717094 RepID=UPI002410436A|nr:DUF6482 family protein [Vibrio hannami]MDG3088959.1 DUF6482 family protein [Vibrio hannami]